MSSNAHCYASPRSTQERVHVKRIGHPEFAPVAADDAYTVDEDSEVSLDVLANDADADALIIESVTQPEHGAVSIEGGGFQGNAAGRQQATGGRMGATLQYTGIDDGVQQGQRRQLGTQSGHDAGEEGGPVLLYVPEPGYNVRDS